MSLIIFGLINNPKAKIYNYLDIGCFLCNKVQIIYLCKILMH